MTEKLPYRISIDISMQNLILYKEEKIYRQYEISSAEKGVGQLKGSLQTPLGRHIIRAKIGEGAPLNTVFVARRPTGEIFSSDLYQQFPGRDWILTRILWLSGKELGKNRLGNCDTMQRYIYIHGTPDSVKLGTPGSHGCIRMRNQDIVQLYDTIPVYTVVEII